MKLKTLAFDFDGTLADTLPLCIASYQATTEEYTGRRPSHEEVEHFFGLNDSGVLAGLLQIDPLSPELPLARFIEIYQQLHPSLAPAPFPGALALLERLKKAGFQLALITGKQDITAEPSLRYFGMDHLFDWCGYGEPYYNAKTERLQELMLTSQLQADELIYIGDAPSDILTSRAAGVKTINAAWAADSARYTSECLALEPAYRLHHLEELEGLIMGISSTQS